MRLNFDEVDDDHLEDDVSHAAWLTQPAAQAAIRSTSTPKRGKASSMLMAAMVGLVDALGWERPKEETVEVANAPIGDDGLILDYRHLEPLD